MYAAGFSITVVTLFLSARNSTLRLGNQAQPGCRPNRLISEASGNEI